MTLEPRTGLGPLPGLQPARPERGSHVVQYYGSDAYLVDEVARFLGAGIRGGEAAVVVGTPAHRDAIERRLGELGFDLADLRRAGRYLALDAAESIWRLSVEGRPDALRFGEVIGSAVAGAARASRAHHVRAFGEMVALLWARGEREAALAIEDLWNTLGTQHSLSLICGYPMSAFQSDGGPALADVSARHNQVIPTEHFMTIADPEEQRRAVAVLEEKAHALEREVTQRRILERQLQAKVQELAEVDRRKDEFLAMLGHELRNPLAPVTAALEVMRLRADDPERAAKARAVVERQVVHMTRLIDDLLDVSRITRGLIELRDERVTLAGLVERAIEMSRPLIDERGHRLVLDLPAQPVVFRGDNSRLEQVLANLLANAAKYTDLGGRIWLRARVEDGLLTLSVRDNGAGLTADLRAHVFDLFVQGPDTRSLARGGLGIGLTLARRLVELHGGTLEAASEGPGQGSEFTLRLPLRPVPADHPSSAGPLPAARQRRVLVIDDNVDAAEALGDLLREYGHVVGTAHGAAAGIAEALRMRPEIVLLDIAMPELDGYDVARRLRPELPDATLVALTGFGEGRHRERSRAAGFDRHLTKPVDLEELQRILAER
jgi:signal transduction histidine kinase